MKKNQIKSAMIHVSSTKVQYPSWKKELAEAVTDIKQLLSCVNLTVEDALALLGERLNIRVDGNGDTDESDTDESDIAMLLTQASKQFSIRVPLRYIEKIKPGNIYDPLLLQVLPTANELQASLGYSMDPLQEAGSEPVPGLLHKYHGRVLLLLSGACAVHCRYCFRRHFDYICSSTLSKNNLEQCITYLTEHKQVSEVILSGGDPLIISNTQLEVLLNLLEQIPHIKRVRIHSRLIAVLPNRIDDKLVQLLVGRRFQVVIVTHINHAQEIDDELKFFLRPLIDQQLRLFNQSVLLKGVNDSVEALDDLSEALFDNHIQPYYLHLLDRVTGAGHFAVEEMTAKQLMKQLSNKLPGYLLPKLVKELPGELSKLVVSFDDVP